MNDQPETGDLADALRSCARVLTTTSRDTGRDRDTAWLYGVLVGWECEDDHEHDWICSGSGALHEIAERHGWNTPEYIERHRRMRAAVKAMQETGDGPYVIAMDRSAVVS